MCRNSELNERFVRTKMLLGDGIERLYGGHVTIFGVGGVGSYVAEAATRSGIGAMTIIDNDTVAESNINRQLHALTDTVGRQKTEVMAERIRQINPYAVVEIKDVFVSVENARSLIPANTDCVVDAIDTVSSKIAIIEASKKMGIPVISSMGMANKIRPEKIELADIAQTSVCPLAKVIRSELKKRGIGGVAVCYSTETPVKPFVFEESDISEGKRPLGSIAFVPSAAGLIIAGWVVRTLCGWDL